MPRTFPRLTCEKVSGHWALLNGFGGGSRVAFTLIEVLAALAVLAITTFVVTSALISVVRTQDLARQLQRGALVVRTIQSRRHVLGYTPQTAEALDDWLVQMEDQPLPEKDPTDRWRLWTLQPSGRPSLRLSFCELLPAD